MRKGFSGRRSANTSQDDARLGDEPAFVLGAGDTPVRAAGLNPVRVDLCFTVTSGQSGQLILSCL